MSFCSIRRYAEGRGEVRFEFSSHAQTSPLNDRDDADALIVDIEGGIGNPDKTDVELMLYGMGEGRV